MIAIPNMDKPKSCYYCPLEQLSECRLLGNKFVEEIDPNDCPLIEIVRCGECKWWNKGFCNNGRADANLKLEGNCFCDEGERRADEN